MKTLEVKARVTYSKNGAVLEAGWVKNWKKLKVPKEDSLFLRLKRDGKIYTVCMRPDEAAGLCAVLNFATWRRLTRSKAKVI
jgi:hypothetical protein